MKLGVAVCVWQRSDLAFLCMDAIAFARDECAKQGLELIPVVGGSERGVFMAKTLKRGLRYADLPNQPLGTKWNLTVEQLRGDQVDGVVCLGSDDFAHPKLYLWAAEQIRAGAQIGGPLGIDMVLRGAVGRRWKGYVGARAGEPVGAGRFLAASLLEQVCWRPWGYEAPRGLDGTMWSGIRPAIDPAKIVTATQDELGGIFDVKVHPKVDISDVADFIKETEPLDVTQIMAWLPERIRGDLLLQVQGPAPRFLPAAVKVEPLESGAALKASVVDAITTVEALRRTMRDERQRRALMRVHATLTAVAKTL